MILNRIIRKAKLLFLVDLGSWLIAQFVKRSIIIKNGLSDHGSTYCKLKNGYNVFAVVSKGTTPFDIHDFSKYSSNSHDHVSEEAQSTLHEKRREPEVLQENSHRIQGPCQTT